ncbi:MAG: CDP-alcohol phosphatidyltransferase family protein [Cycloclasticus sp.]
MTRRDIPNVISIIRIILVLPIIYLLWHEHYVMSLILFTVAGLSDALDGFLAKRFDWTSQLGSFLDPLADKLLLVSCFLVGVIIILLRDLIIALGAVAYHFMIEEFQGAPPFSSKLNTTFQIIYLVMVISSQGVIDIPESWINFTLYAVAATTSISGLEYIWTWGFKAWDIKKGR